MLDARIGLSHGFGSTGDATGGGATASVGIRF
jgi:hypothetical protein